MKRSGWPTTSRQSRGYGSAWDALRLRILKRDCGICQCDECKANNRVTVADQVHHIKAKADGGTDDPSNLQAIAATCHKRETMRERGARPIERRAIGIDGFPVAQ